MMKKIYLITLTFFILVCGLSACGRKKEEYSLSVGVVMDRASDGLGVTTTSAAVVTNSENKVVLCRVDEVEVIPRIEDGKIKIERSYKTGYEQGESYKIQGEAFYKQAEFFEKYIEGRTADEISAISAEDKALVDGCKLNRAALLNAVKNAVSSAHKTEFKASAPLTCAVGVLGTAENIENEILFTTDVGATTLVGGKVVSAVIDSVEGEMTVNNGEVEEFFTKGSKLYLGDSYGMKEQGGAIAEWYVQAQNYANTARGKKTDALEDLRTEGVTGCTIYVDNYKKALIRSAQKTR